ncbi:MAG TPA: MarR family transcriptional regulator [Actinocrinis sp.]|jgi:DNA-binding MarR family transcriptional regulator
MSNADTAAPDPGPEAEDEDQAGTVELAAVLQNLYATVFRHAPRDISLTSVGTLSTLDRTGPRRLTDLAVIEGITQPSMTSLVTSLEQAGLVERRKDPADKRVALIALTDAGAAYIRERRRTTAQLFARLLGKLPPHEVAALGAAIPALEHLRELDNAEREPPPPARRPPGTVPVPHLFTQVAGLSGGDGSVVS